MTIKTADLCDEFADRVRIADPVFRAYGGRAAFGGPVTTLRVFEDNVLVRGALEEPGDGRVLVERVEGFAAEAEWHRAFSEINQFEEQLIEGGAILMKFWLHISQDEQLARFKDREQVPYKQHKITDEDWRNREKWGDYKLAVNEMVIRTSTEYAPWTLVPGNDKLFARIHVLQTICGRLEQALANKDYHHSGYLPCAVKK